VAAVFLVLACAPLGLDNFGIEGLRDVLLFATFAVSLDLFWGRTGILSFGHATFFGLGAYGMAIATVVLSLDPSYGSLAGLGLGVALRPRWPWPSGISSSTAESVKPISPSSRLHSR
jgi:ABC-type branched-subunit amino acid transport system permease subunit